MRFDHLVIHVDNDPQKLQSLKEAASAQGYPFDPAQGNRNSEVCVSNINIGPEYVEVVRILKPDTRSWMPLWVQSYQKGERGASCIFIEVEDVERTAVALKKAGVPARGPSVLTYPGLLGLLKSESPYFIYYLPQFSGANLQIALMQYKKTGGRETLQAGLHPNAEQNGIHGIRRVVVSLPNLDENLGLIKRVFADLELQNDQWVAQLQKMRLVFGQSPDDSAHLRVDSVTSQRANLGKKFQIDNVEFVTIGG